MVAAGGMIRPRYSPATHVYVAAPIWSGVRESNPAVQFGRLMPKAIGQPRLLLNAFDCQVSSHPARLRIMVGEGRIKLPVSCAQDRRLITRPLPENSNGPDPLWEPGPLIVIVF